MPGRLANSVAFTEAKIFVAFFCFEICLDDSLDKHCWLFYGLFGKDKQNKNNKQIYYLFSGTTFEFQFFCRNKCKIKGIN